jgi:phosphoribosylamine--glycine ligase / phosphoribosylformylglycinamidine cyclo-ligase
MLYFEKVRLRLSSSTSPHSLIVGIPVFGPTALAARMEGSKAFSKEFMARLSIPTAEFKVFCRDQFDRACEYVRSSPHRVVLKASGLAAGKGVLIPENTHEALDALKQILIENAFGSAGMCYVL